MSTGISKFSFEFEFYLKRDCSLPYSLFLAFLESFVDLSGLLIATVLPSEQGLSR